MARNQLRSVQVTYSDGTCESTSMAAGLTDDQIRAYFAIGRQFNIGNGELDRMATVVSIKILK